MTIRIQNNAMWITVGGEDHLKGDVKSQIKKYFSVEATNSYWASQKGGRKYFGATQLMTPKGMLPTGFLPKLIKFAKSLEVDIQIIDERSNIPTYNTENTQYTFENKLKGFSYDLKAHPYDHQGSALDKLINNKILVGDDEKSETIYYPRGIINFATNAGKSIFSYALYKNLVENTRTLYLVHSVKIYKQMYDFLTKEMGEDIGRVDSEVCEFKNFTIAMQKTLGNRLGKSKEVLSEFRKGFGLLIVDEAHKCAASDYARLIRKVDAGSKVFVSGTPLKMKDPLKKLKVIGLSGSVIDTISKKELMDKGVSEKLTVHLLYNKVDPFRYHGSLKLPLVGYKDHLKFGIHKSEERIKLALDWLTKNAPDKYVLVSFHDIVNGHGDLLNKMFCDHYGLAKVSYIHGQMPKKDQEIQEADFKEKRTQIMIASTVWKEGLNIPHIDVLVYSLGGKSEITLSQISGRLERKSKGEGAILLDYYDDDNKHLATHSRARAKFFKNEQIEVITEYEADRYLKPKKRR